MAVVSMMRVSGDADELAARIREHVEPVAQRLAPKHDGLGLIIARLAAWLGQNPLEQLLGAARLNHLLHLVVVDLGEREPLGEADRVHEPGDLAEAPLDDLTLVGCEVFPRPARDHYACSVRGRRVECCDLLADERALVDLLLLHDVAISLLNALKMVVGCVNSVLPANGVAQDPEPVMHPARASLRTPHG